MSISGAKAQLKTAVQAVTWTVPTSASGIAYLNSKTKFSRVDTQRAGGGDQDIDQTDFPYCLIHLPDLDEQRKTDGGDLMSRKDQQIPAHLFMYLAGMASDWQALGDYRDAVVDGVMAYFRRNSSPSPGLVSPGDNDHVIGWGLQQSARCESPDLFGEVMVYRSTVTLTVRMEII